jgi:hypothetical protein
LSAADIVRHHASITDAYERLERKTGKFKEISASQEKKEADPKTGQRRFEEKSQERYEPQKVSFSSATRC